MLCTYNGERFLKAQIDSLLQQSYPNIEIVISDDASTDATVSILAGYEDDKRFRITYQKENLGAVGNFEFAAGQAQGEFVAFSDQDDIWLPEKIEKLYAAIGNHYLVYCDSILIDENGQSLQKNLSQLRRMEDVNDTRGFVFSNVVWGHAMMIRKELLPHVLPIPTGIPHDIWFAFKATALTGIVYLDQALTLYRQHSGTYTTTIAQKAKTRSYEKRYKDFEEKLNWITLMRDHAPEAERAFYKDLQPLYYNKSKDTSSLPLFRFLLKHQKLLFGFTRKKYLSRLVEIRKLSRRETCPR